MNIRKFNMLGQIITLNITEKYIQVNDNKKVTFERMNEIQKEFGYCNDIYKPTALLVYIAYKNGKLSKYKDVEI